MTEAQRRAIKKYHAKKAEIKIRTSAEMKKIDNMLKYYEDKGCEVKRLFSFLGPS